MIKKQQQKIDFFLLPNCPLKGSQGDAVFILSALKVFLKRMKQKRPLKVHPPNVVWGTLILFNLKVEVSQFLNTGIERQH